MTVYVLGHIDVYDADCSAPRVTMLGVYTTREKALEAWLVHKEHNPNPFPLGGPLVPDGVPDNDRPLRRFEINALELDAPPSF